MYSKSLILGAALASIAFAGPQSGDPSMPSGPTGTHEDMVVHPTPPFPTGDPETMPPQATNVFWATGLSRHPNQPEPTGRKHMFSEDTLEKMYKKWCGVCPSGQVCFPPSSIVRREVVNCMINRPVGDLNGCPQAKGHCGPPEHQGGLNDTMPRIPGTAEPSGRVPPFHILKPVEDAQVSPSGVSSASDPTITDAPTDPTNTDVPSTEPTDA